MVEWDTGKERGGTGCVHAEAGSESTNGLTVYSDRQHHEHFSGLDCLAPRCGKAYCEWCLAFAARNSRTNMPTYES
jgi:hypothetical protein